jgi:hypothetical protein
MADYDPLMYAPHAPGAPPPPQQNVPQQNNPPPQQQEPLFIGPQNLVGPRLPPIDDIVANDPEIRRICSELARFLETKANNSYVIDYAHATGRAAVGYNNPILSINEYRYKPTDTLFYPTTFIEPVKIFVRNATKPNRPQMYNPQAAIATLENSLNNTLSDANLGSASSSDVSSRGPYFMPNVDPNQMMKRVYSSVQIPGGIPFLNELYHYVLLKPGEGMIDKNTARQYVNLILQLYRRIQAILVENGFQQGGKKRRRQTKTKRKRRQTKKRRRTYKK